MQRDRGFSNGSMFGIALVIAALGLHWFITPANHPDAGPITSVLVAVQVVVSLSIAAWAFIRDRRHSA